MSSSQTMRSLQVSALGDSPSLNLSHVQVPAPERTQLLIKVESFSLAFVDQLMARGQYQSIPETPFTVGKELAGTVIQVGSEVTRFRVGDRVAAVVPHGAAADYALAIEHVTFALPPHVSFTQGSALPVNFLTAHFALKIRAGLKMGETVLVHGAAGGIGSASLQLTKLLGAKSIAVVSTQEKAAVAHQLGANDVVFVDSFKDSVMELTGGRGVNVVVDVVGDRVLLDSLRTLAPNGRLLTLGFAGGGAIPSVKLNRLLLNNIDVRGVGWEGYTDLNPDNALEQWNELAPHFASGNLRAIVKPYEFDDVLSAFEALRHRNVSGKIVVSTQ